MAYNPPAIGQPDWGDELLETLEYLKVTAEGSSQSGTDETVTGLKTFESVHGDWVNIDLSTVDVTTGTYNATENRLEVEATNGRLDAYWNLAFDWSKYYELQFTLTQNNAGPFPIGSTATWYTAPNNWLVLGGAALVDANDGPTVNSFLVGPGLEGWPAAGTTDTQLNLYLHGAPDAKVTGIRYRALARTSDLNVGGVKLLAQGDGESLRLPDSTAIYLNGSQRVITTLDYSQAGRLIVGANDRGEVVPLETPANKQILVGKGVDPYMSWVDQTFVARLVHDGTAYPARPTHVAYAEWVGPVEPTAALDYDTWIDTSPPPAGA